MAVLTADWQSVSEVMAKTTLTHGVVRKILIKTASERKIEVVERRRGATMQRSLHFRLKQADHG
jgi:hypothetical protein